MTATFVERATILIVAPATTAPFGSVSRPAMPEQNFCATCEPFVRLVATDAAKRTNDMANVIECFISQVATEHPKSVSEPPHNTALGGIIHHMSEKRLREQLRDLARLRHLGIR